MATDDISSRVTRLEGTTVKLNQLANFNTRYDTSINNINGEIDDLETSVSAIQRKLSILMDKINAQLRDGVTGATGPTGGGITGSTGPTGAGGTGPTGVTVTGPTGASITGPTGPTGAGSEGVPIYDSPHTVTNVNVVGVIDVYTNYMAI